MVPISVTGVHNCLPNCFITGQGGPRSVCAFPPHLDAEKPSWVLNMYLLAAVISQERVIYLYAIDSDSNTFNGNSHGWLCSREGGKGRKGIWGPVDVRNSCVLFRYERAKKDKKKWPCSSVHLVKRKEVHLSSPRYINAFYRGKLAQWEEPRWDSPQETTALMYLALDFGVGVWRREKLRITKASAKPPKVTGDDSSAPCYVTWLIKMMGLTKQRGASLELVLSAFCQSDYSVPRLAAPVRKWLID